MERIEWSLGSKELVVGIIIAVFAITSLVLTGAHIAHQQVNTDRFVTVKGLAEKEVPADLVIWPLHYQVVAKDAESLYKKLAQQQEIIISFLEQGGFKRENMTFGQPRTMDNSTHYREKEAPENRFFAEASVILRSSEVDSVREYMQKSNELIKHGVVITENYGNSIEYFYTALNQIKPEMIATATKNARLAAQKFAADSGSAVGNIRKATQGYFSINNRDQYTPHLKKVRIVTTIEYFLE